MHWGPGAEDLYGWAGPDVLGRSILEVTPTVSSAATATEIMTGLVEGGSWSGIVELRRRIFGGIGVATDDPKRVFIEPDLNFLASMADVIGSVIEREELDRLKSEFVSTVSYELRTPLSSVLAPVRPAPSPPNRPTGSK